ncbi:MULTISPECIES: hypothetical protein [Mycobacterium]|uniref:hypothetical protein n=1 Tax=Mycobacterium TaxID=1763 RepID=UPI0002D60178|nr:MULTISPECIES: hypothetical protein [Mycobacterium]MCV7232783.1 hypothetical protein [Mycobacterium branderi]
MTFRHSAQQIANARRNSAKATRERHQRDQPQFDWDKAIASLKAMLDKLEAR